MTTCEHNRVVDLGDGVAVCADCGEYHAQAKTGRVRAESAKMDENVNWDEGVSSGNFIRFANEEPKEIVLTAWNFRKVHKFGEEKMEFFGTVLEEDGKEVKKEFTTVSEPLKRKLRGVLADRKPTEKVKIRVTKIQGDKPTDVTYSVKEVKMA